MHECNFQRYLVSLKYIVLIQRVEDKYCNEDEGDEYCNEDYIIVFMMIVTAKYFFINVRRTC